MGTTSSQLLDAVMTLTAERGLDAVSVREVAAAAGVSIGTVQYHFATKDDLLVAAFARVVDDTRARLRRIEVGPGVRDTMIRALSQLLPLDSERRREGQVYLAFAARAAVAPGLRVIQRDLLNGVRDEVAAVLAEADPGRDAAAVRIDAAVLLATVDGLLLHELSTGRRGAKARLLPALERAVDLMLGGDADPRRTG